MVGFGTSQLQLVPERQAIDTLCRGFELGVNWVHLSVLLLSLLAIAWQTGWRVRWRRQQRQAATA